METCLNKAEHAAYSGARFIHVRNQRYPWKDRNSLPKGAIDNATILVRMFLVDEQGSEKCQILPIEYARHSWCVILVLKPCDLYVDSGTSCTSEFVTITTIHYERQSRNIQLVCIRTPIVLKQRMVLTCSTPLGKQVIHRRIFLVDVNSHDDKGAVGLKFLPPVCC